MDLSIVGRSGIDIKEGDCYICKERTDKLIIFSDVDTRFPYGFCLKCLKEMVEALEKTGCQLGYQTVGWTSRDPSDVGYVDINAQVYEATINGRVCFLLKGNEGDMFWKVFVQDHTHQGILHSDLEEAKKIAYEAAHE